MCDFLWSYGLWDLSTLLMAMSLQSNFTKAIPPALIRGKTGKSEENENVTADYREHTPALPWRHNGHDGVSNHQTHYYLLNGLSRCRSKKTSMLRVTGLCAGNSPVTGEFPAQMASNVENASIWWRHHVSSRESDTSSPRRCDDVYFLGAELIVFTQFSCFYIAIAYIVIILRLMQTWIAGWPPKNSRNTFFTIQMWPKSQFAKAKWISQLNDNYEFKDM